MMRSELFQEAVDSFKKRQPFQPFVVEMDDGQRLVIGQPGELHSYLGAATYHGPDGELMFVDSIDVKQVISLEPAVSK